MLIDTLKTDALAARKAAAAAAGGADAGAAKKKAALLTTVISGVEMRAKDDNRQVTDNDVTATIKAFSKGIEQSLDAAPVERKADYQSELDTLKAYVPEALEGDALVAAIKAAAIVVNVVVERKSMKSIMDVLNKTYPGRVDGKLVSDAVGSWKA